MSSGIAILLLCIGIPLLLICAYIAILSHFDCTYFDGDSDCHPL